MVTSGIQSIRSPSVGSVTRSMEMERKVMDLVEKRVGELLEKTTQAQNGKLDQITDAIAANNLQNQKNKLALENG